MAKKKIRRSAVKTLKNKELEFIPKGHKDFDPKAKDIYDRPLIFVGQRMSRDEYFEFQEQTDVDFPEGMDVSKMKPAERMKNAIISGKGKAYKYAWDVCISKLKNVILEIDGKEEAFEKYTDLENIWNNAQGLQEEIMGALAYFIGESSFKQAEAKN